MTIAGCKRELNVVAKIKKTIINAMPNAVRRNGVDDDADGHIDDGCARDLDQEDNFSEDIFAVSDLKIVTDFFLDLDDLGGNAWQATFVPALGAAEEGNQCQDNVDNDNDGIVNDGCPTEGHQKEALHNNGPYGPTDVTVSLSLEVTSDPANCNVTYDVRGDETEINGRLPITDHIPADSHNDHFGPGDQISSQSGSGGSQINVTFPATLPVSTDVWFAELWRFSSTDDECNVTIDKHIEADNIHITGSDDFTKFVVVCLDNDADGVHNSGGNCNGPDDCPDAFDPEQLDTDNDGIGDACDPDPDRPPVDALVKYVLTIGPAAINLSDTTGRYMWIIAEIGENGSDPGNVEVTVSMSIDATNDAVPNDCTRTPLDDNPADGILSEALVLPGQDNFILLDDEQKTLVWRVRYECHSPATTQTFDQTVTVEIDLTGDGNPNNDSITVVKTIIVH